MTDQGTSSGVSYSVVNPDSGSVVVFQLETSGDAQMNDSLAALLDSTLKLFKPV
jgi:hypothetical protein